MKSSKRGRSTSASAKVEDISPHGVWLLVNRKEYFLPYTDFPWFKGADSREIRRLEFHRGEHLHWPDLDVDLHMDSLRNPGKYPLVYAE